MLHFRLPDHLGVCEVDGRILMLDLRRDRYFELDAGTASEVRRWREQRNGLSGAATLPRLVERGILVAADSTETDRWRGCHVPCRSLLDRAPPRRGSILPLLPEIAATLWQVRKCLKQAGLERAVAEARRQKSSANANDSSHHATLFRAARRLVPVAPNCLTDSLALSTFLARRDVRSDLVFGVKLDPFAAHCWLQNDEVILNDAADSVGTFTPILVV